MMGNLTVIFGSAVVCIIALFIIGFISARLYKRSSKEISFVRTGFGGQKVIMNGGALCIPVLQEIIKVNMNTLRLPVTRANDQALITRDRMRVDVVAEFYVRVQPSIESIANAAQTLGNKTLRPEELKNLVEGKFVDALRSVAAEMSMVELHEKRVDFVQKVQQVVTEDLLKNGLELESVSLTGLDQTPKEFFNPNNAFDAEGLTRLTEEIERRKKVRNDIEQDTAVQIRNKNLEAAKQILEIDREEEYAKLQQEREIAIRKAEQTAAILKEEAEKRREAENAKIQAEQKVEQAKILARRAIEEDQIEKERAIETQNIDRKKTIELANQEREIAVAEKSKEESLARANADLARATAVEAEEKVVTTKEREIAERQKQIELIDASKQAEREAIAVRVSAEAEKAAAADLAEAMRLEAKGQGDKVRITATAEAEAEKVRAAAAEVRYSVEAAGQHAVNAAANILSDAQISMQVKLKLLEHLEGLISASAKPMERIEGIKIIQVGGLPGGSTGAEGASASGGGSLADQVVNSALRYRAQAPLLDTLLKEVGLQGKDLTALLKEEDADNPKN
ncbi:MAG: flotillin family protein [Deltaproteobacteria bacterium]|nr:flotillin family protein [Deltaproteobacteria bacterium]